MRGFSWKKRGFRWKFLGKCAQFPIVTVFCKCFAREVTKFGIWHVIPINDILQQRRWYELAGSMGRFIRSAVPFPVP